MPLFYGTGIESRDDQEHPPPTVSFDLLGTLTSQSGNNGSSNIILTPELQFARCMSNRYRSEAFSRCISCTRRWAGDTCRFQNVRILLRDVNRIVQTISFTGEHSTRDKPGDTQRMQFPVNWNLDLELVHIQKIRVRSFRIQ